MEFNHKNSFLMVEENQEMAYTNSSEMVEVGQTRDVQLRYDISTEAKVSQIEYSFDVENTQKKFAQAENKVDPTGSNVLVTFMLIFVVIDILGAGFLLYVMLRKRDDKKDSKKDKDETKMKSVAALPVAFALANLYSGPAYVVLYVLSIIAIVAWIAVIVVFLIKRYKEKTVSKEASKPVKEEKVVEKPVEKKVVAEEPKVEEPVEKKEVTKKPKARKPAMKKGTAKKAVEKKTAPVKPVAEKPKAKKAPAKKRVAKTPASEVKKEVETATEKVVRIRHVKSFTARFSQSNDTVKEYYSELKNYALSFKNTRSRTSWSYDSINVGRKQVIKFAIRGKSLCMFLALNPDDFASTKYKVKRTQSKRYQSVPCLYRITNERRRKYAKDLIDKLMKQLNLEKNQELNHDYKIQFEETDALLQKGLIKEYKKTI